jgi:hypothetical protein
VVKCKRERERGLGNKIERECFGPHKDEYRAGFELGSSEFHYHLTIDKREGKGQPGSCRLEKAKGREGMGDWGLADAMPCCSSDQETRKAEREVNGKDYAGGSWL